MICNILLQVYPIGHENNTRQIWEQKGYEHATTEEKDKYQQLKKEREHIQNEISKHDKYIDKLEKQMQLTKWLQEWRSAETFLKNTKSNILYARQPIIDIWMKPRRHTRYIHEFCDHIKITPDQQNQETQINSFGRHKIHVRTYSMTKQLTQYHQKTCQRKRKIHENTRRRPSSPEY